MFISTTCTYPPDKNVKVLKKFIEATAKPLPSFIKRVSVLGTSRVDIGFKVNGLYEIDDAKIKEGILELTKYYNQFTDIEGCRYELEPMLTPQDMIALLGIKP
jgi:hypothetical protein